MNCCLWLNGVKVWKTCDIKNNFDPASLHGYFRGGSLLRWLKANGGEEEAKKLEETGNIEYAFGIIDELPTTPSGVRVAPTCHPSKEGNIVVITRGSFPSSGGTCRAESASGGVVYGSGSGSGSSSGCLGYGLHII